MSTRAGNQSMVVGLVVTGAVLMLVVLVLVASSFTRFISPLIPESMAGQPSAPVVEPLILGTSGSGTPVVATDCPETCFALADIDAVFPTDDDRASLSLTRKIDVRTPYPQTTVAEQFDSTRENWRAQDGDPDGCLVVYYTAPIALPADSPTPVAGGEVYEMGTWSDIEATSSLSHFARVFDTSQAALDHMEQLKQQVADCGDYSLIGDVGPWRASVTLAPALSLPDSVAAVGWVEEGNSGRYYGFDVQRGNLVVRTLVSTAGQVTESDYRTYIEGLARQFDQLGQVGSSAEPASGCTSGPCLQIADALSLAPTSDALSPWGSFSADASYPAGSSSDVGAFDDAARSQFTAGNGTPVACYFALSEAPVSPASPSFYTRDDQAVSLGRYADATDSLTASAVVFDSEVYAGRYISTLRSPIDQCSFYQYDTPDGEVRSVTLTRLLPSLQPTNGVSSMAWVETYEAGTTLVADLQYRNVSLRIVLNRGASSAVTDEQFRQYVQSVAAQLAQLG